MFSTYSLRYKTPIIKILIVAKNFAFYLINILHFLPALETQTEKASEGELALLHSELWSSLFRGGYRVGKLQRSLSGYYVCLHIFISISFFISLKFVLFIYV